MQEFNLGLDTIVEFLHKNSSPIERSPVAKLTAGELDLLRKEYSSSAQEKKEASGISIGHKHNEKIVIDGDLHKERRRPSEEEMDEPIARRNIHNIPGPPKPTPAPAPPVPTPVKVQPVAVEPPSPPPLPPAPVEKPVPPVEAEAPKAPEPAKVEKISEPVVSETTSTKTESAEPELIKAESASVQGLKVIGKIDLDARKKGSKPKTESTPVPAKPVVEPVKKEAKPEPVKEAPKPERVVPTPVVQAPAPEPTPEIVVEAPAVSTPTEEAPGVGIKGEADQLKGLTVLGKIDLKAFENKKNNPSESSS